MISLPKKTGIAAGLPPGPAGPGPAARAAAPERLFDIEVLLFDEADEERDVPQSNHRDKSPQLTQNQNNKMSEDPGDGSRTSDRLGADGSDRGIRKAPEEIAQDEQETLEALGERGAGIAPKE
jgi:hypothetical protein